MTRALPETMTCVEIGAPGGPEVLRLCQRPLPRPGAGEVLVRVAAAGVNGPDLYQRQGLYPPPPGASDIPGLEIAGEIVALGAETAGWQIGDAVCALVSGGGYASHCLAPAATCLPVPAGLETVDAAALPETVFTVWTNLYQRGRLAAGETLLVHGGGGGIGTTAVQIASALGATVYTTAGGDAKCRRLEALGAARAIDYRTEDFVAVVRDLTARRGVDVILDMVGGDYVARNLRCLAVEGRLVLIAFRQGSTVEIDLMPVMLKRQTVTGSTLRIQSVEAKAAIAAAVRARVWPLIEAGRIRPIVHARLPLAEAAEAHALMESGGHFGKIVLLPGAV